MHKADVRRGGYAFEGGSFRAAGFEIRKNRSNSLLEKCSFFGVAGALSDDVEDRFIGERGVETLLTVGDGTIFALMASWSDAVEVGAVESKACAQNSVLSRVRVERRIGSWQGSSTG
jgi:hypothetical protein